MTFRYFLALLPLLAFGASEEVIPHRQDRPPNKPYSAEEAVQHMTVPPGFTVEIVAAEPDIVNPIAMCFDDQGRIYVTESVEYPRESSGPGKDRVKLLEDTNGDGRVDKVTILADNLNIPSGVAVGYGGIWVLNSPDLLFIREKEGKEVSREVVVTGFGRTDRHELPSSLTWGPDGWLYGLNGVFNQSKVKSNNGKEYTFNCAMWRVHPVTKEFQIVSEGTSNPYGIAWDSEGSTIVEACHWANDHLFHFVETGHYQRQAGTFPAFAMKIGSITDHGHQKTAYCGISYFDSDSYPEQFRKKIYVGNIHGGCINVDRLQRDGSSYLAKAEPDFLNANDAWFMPVALKTGPDGSLYVLDWYDRYHCYQDANRDPVGIDRLKGRLYRVRYKETPRGTNFNLATESNRILLSRLDSPNIYFRETAQRILSERLQTSTGKENLRKQLENQTLDHGNRSACLHALWTLIGSFSLDENFHATILSDSDAALRAWGVRAAGNFATKSSVITNSVGQLTRDPSPDVQLQVVIAAPKIPGFDALAVILDVLAHCSHDKLIPAIGWQNLHPFIAENPSRFAGLFEKTVQERHEFPAAFSTLLPKFSERLMGIKPAPGGAIAMVLQLAIQQEPRKAAECIGLISEKVAASPDTRNELAKSLKPVLEKVEDPRLLLSSKILQAHLGLAPLQTEEVRKQFLDSKNPAAARIEALDVLMAFRDTSLITSNLSTILLSETPAFVRQVFSSIGKNDNPRIADVILGVYEKLPSELQPQAIDLLLQREPWARKLLDRVIEKKLPTNVLNANHLRKILDSNDREAVWAVEKAFGKVREERNPEREKVVAEMSEYLKTNIGNPQAGHNVFKNLCAQCHTIYGEGGAVGPDLTANGRASFEQLLSNVFDPSLVIGPAYQVVTVVTKDSRNLTGLVTEENKDRVVIRMPGEGEETIPRNNVKYTRVSKLSMMPEGIENLISKRDLSDLFAFLALDKLPQDPDAKLIPGAPKIEKQSKLSINVDKTRLGVVLGGNEILSYVMETNSRPYLHPVREPSGAIIITADRPEDHPWQHGIFTGYRGNVNGHEYWLEKAGQIRFRKLLQTNDGPGSVSWRALSELIDPAGKTICEEEQFITVYPPANDENYYFDFQLLLRAKESAVHFDQWGVGGLAARMPWEQKNPRQAHLNSEGQRGLECEKQRAAWCMVERPFGSQIFGIAILDHPQNFNYPSQWRVDEQGLINPTVTGVVGWDLKPSETKTFHYRVHIYKGSATAGRIQKWFTDFQGAKQVANAE